MKLIFSRDVWGEIFSSVSKNKLRTAITIVGVLWGVFIYIALSGAAKGMDNGFERAFENVAMNSMFAWAQSTSIPYDGFKTGRSLQLKMEDVTTLKNRIPDLQYVAPRNAKGVFDGSGGALFVRGQKTGTYTVYGDLPVFTKISTKKIYEGGRFINDSDIENSRKVCVIGERTQKELFDKDEEAVGKFIRIDNVYFQVIGVHKFVPGGGFESDGDVFRKYYPYHFQDFENPTFCHFWEKASV